MDTTVKFHPALFSRAWLNLEGLTKLSVDFEKTYLLELHHRGAWLVALAGEALGACWLPYDVGDERPDSFRAVPVESVLIGDGDGRIAERCKYEWKRWKKSSLDAGDDEFMIVGPPPYDAVIAKDKAKGDALPGLKRPIIRVRNLDWHQDTVQVERPVPDWRQVFRTHMTMGRESCTLPGEVMKALAAIEGCSDPTVDFDSGTGALFTYRPAEGIRPVTFVRVYVGKRAGDEDQLGEPAEDLTLIPQRYDDADGYVDDTDDEPGQLTTEQLAEQAAGNALADLVG